MAQRYTNEVPLLLNMKICPQSITSVQVYLQLSRQACWLRTDERQPATMSQESIAARIVFFLFDILSKDYKKNQVIFAATQKDVGCISKRKVTKHLFT